jgi:hypothetical protein
VAHDIRGVDTKRVENADYITDRVLNGIRSHSLRASGTPQATQVRRDYAEAVLDQKRDLVAPKIRRVRPPVEQEHRLTAAKILNVQ